MADSPLQQVAESPAVDMAPTASGGNPLIAQMMQNMLTQGSERSDYIAKQQAAYNQDMDQYSQMVQQSRTPEANEAGMWGAISEGASSVAPNYGNLGQMIGRAGGAYGAQQEAQRNNDLKAQAELAKMRQNELRALETSKQSSQMLKALQPGKSNWIQFKDDAGNLHMMDKSQGPGTEVVIPASQNAQWLKLLAQGHELAIKQDEPDKEQFALDYATRMARMLKPGVAASSAQQPTTTSVGRPTATSQLAVTDSNATTMPSDGSEGLGAGSSAAGTVEVSPSLTQMLSPADRAVAERLINRINANPSASTNDMRTLENIIRKYDERAAAPAPAAQRGSSGSIAEAAGRKVAAEEQAKLATARQMKSEEAQGTGEGRQIAEAPEKKTVLENYLGETKQTLDAVKTLISHPGLDKATGLAGYIPGRGRVAPVAGTDSAEYLAALKTLNSRITSLALQNARVGSAAGATGYGALDQGEREMLRDSVKSLANEQNPDTVRKHLKYILDTIQNSERLAKEGYERTYGKGESKSEAPTTQIRTWNRDKGAFE